ncbi:MAG: hypothetical protein FWH18_07185 [Marinilabiliaceae bacterium]|nr:hypothetical protein [Marinilabiliaceae bacterium]
MNEQNKNIETFLIENLTVNPDKKGLYKVIINYFSTTIQELEYLGYNLSMIIENIEYRIKIPKGTIKYHSFYRAYNRYFKEKKEANKTILPKTNNHINSELEKLDLNIKPKEKKNIFEEHYNKIHKIK